MRSKYNEYLNYAIQDITRQPTGCRELLLRVVQLEENESSSMKGIGEQQCVTQRLGRGTYDAAIHITHSHTALWLVY